MVKKSRQLDNALSKQTLLFDFDNFQVDELAQSTEPGPGSLNIGLRVKEGLSLAMKSIAFKRYEIAGRMSEYIGVEITDSMLNSWTAESKEGYRFPLEYLPAFCQSSGNFDVLDMIVRICGCKLVRSEETALLELARIEHAKRQLAQKEKTIIQYLDQTRPKTSDKILPMGGKR